MKIKSQLLAILIFSLFQISISSCESDDDQQEVQQPDPLTISYECIDSDTITEVFVVLPHPATFGSNEGDLSDYIISSIEIASLEEIENGEIRLKVLIFDTGEPCLSGAFGTDIPEESLIGHDALINAMPNWTPAKQGDTPRHYYVLISINIIDGEIESVT